MGILTNIFWLYRNKLSKYNICVSKMHIFLKTIQTIYLNPCARMPWQCVTVPKIIGSANFHPQDAPFWTLPENPPVALGNAVAKMRRNTKTRSAVTTSDARNLCKTLITHKCVVAFQHCSGCNAKHSCPKRWVRQSQVFASLPVHVFIFWWGVDVCGPNVKWTGLHLLQDAGKTLLHCFEPSSKMSLVLTCHRKGAVETEGNNQQRGSVSNSFDTTRLRPAQIQSMRTLYANTYVPSFQPTTEPTKINQTKQPPTPKDMA